MPKFVYPLVEGDVWQSIHDEVGESPGTYRVKLWMPGRTDYLPIPRLMDVDKGGTLYIGTSQNVPSRVGTLKKAILAAYTGGKRYSDKEIHPVGHRINQRFINRFPVELLSLEVEVHPLVEGNQWSYFEDETRLLNEYWLLFGEFPPMNGPKRTEKYTT